MMAKTRHPLAKNDAANKTRPIVWMVSHCRANGKWETYVRQLSQYIPVDVYDKCGNFSCPRNEANCISDPKCYDMLQTRYKFYLSFEMSFAPITSRKSSLKSWTTTLYRSCMVRLTIARLPLLIRASTPWTLRRKDWPGICNARCQRYPLHTTSISGGRITTDYEWSLGNPRWPDMGFAICVRNSIRMRVSSFTRK
jgi:hypothetical protein